MHEVRPPLPGAIRPALSRRSRHARRRTHLLALSSFRPVQRLPDLLRLMNRLYSFVFAALALSLTLGSISPALAQSQTRTLTIHDNTVYVNGAALDQEQLPESLDVSGIEAQYRFLGIRKPVVEINGMLYAITDRLEPVSEDEVRQQSDASVILQRPQVSSAERGVSAASSRSAAAQRENRAAQSSQTPSPAGEPTEASDMRAARQAYLSEIQRRHQELYRNLVRERRMEADSREIARTIRLLPDGPERDAQVDTLRATLNRIFELKQENRRREIEQLQGQIDELERRLEQRETMREEMINRRMDELMGVEE